MINRLGRNLPITQHGKKKRYIKRWKWGGSVFFLAVLIQGMPIARTLTAPQSMGAAERFKYVSANAATIGLESTIVVALIWATFYCLAGFTVYRFGQRSLGWTIKKEWSLFLLVLLVPFSLLRSEFSGPIMMNTIHTIGAVLIAFASAKHYYFRPRVWLQRLGAVLGINVAVHVLSVFLMPGLTVAYDGRWQGLTTNANTLGLIGFLTLWANSTRMVIERKFYWFAGVCTIFAACALWGTQSMTSILCAIISIALVVFLSNRLLWDKFIRLILKISPLILLLLYVYWDATSSDIAFVTGRTQDFSGRLDHWKDAIMLIFQKPILGWGFDNNATVISVVHLPTVHFHNGFLDLAVRGGMVAVFLFGVILVKYYKSIGNHRRNHTLAVITVPFVISMLIYNMTEVSFCASRNVQWLTFLVVLFMSVLCSRVVRRNY